MNKHQRDRERRQAEKWNLGKQGKPQSNRVMCPTAKKMKQLFESEGEARNFIKFNADKLAYGSDSLRVYWCDACAGYHISSKQYRLSYDGMTDRLIERARQSTKKLSKIAKLEAAQQIWLALPTEVKNYDLKDFGIYLRDFLEVDINSSVYQSGVLKLYKEYHR